MPRIALAICCNAMQGPFEFRAHAWHPRRHTTLSASIYKAQEGTNHRADISFARLLAQMSRLKASARNVPGGSEMGSTSQRMLLQCCSNNHLSMSVRASFADASSARIIKPACRSCALAFLEESALAHITSLQHGWLWPCKPHTWAEFASSVVSRRYPAAKSAECLLLNRPAPCEGSNPCSLDLL